MEYNSIVKDQLSCSHRSLGYTALVNQFDTLYFSKYLGEGDELLFVCHRHPILIIDTIILWCFFGVLLPVFFYLQNTF